MANLVEEAKAGNVAGVRRELDAGANIDQLDSGKDTALTWSAFNGHTEVVRLLIDRGANINIPNVHGALPYRLAKDYNHPEAAQLIEIAAMGPRESWQKAGTSSVAHVGLYADIGQRLTTVFNFKSRDRIIIAENISKGTQGVSAATSFESLPQGVVEEALEQFEKLGGVADRDFVLNGTTALGKPKLRAAGG